jgi:hypothetical protein
MYIISVILYAFQNGHFFQISKTIVQHLAWLFFCGHIIFCVVCHPNFFSWTWKDFLNFVKVFFTKAKPLQYHVVRLYIVGFIAGGSKTPPYALKSCLEIKHLVRHVIITSFKHVLNVYRVLKFHNMQFYISGATGIQWFIKFLNFTILTHCASSQI